MGILYDTGIVLHGWLEYKLARIKNIHPGLQACLLYTSYLEAGDLVVADGRILENYSLQVNESSLTGESTNVDKSDGLIHDDCALADRANMVYSSGLVTYGRAVVLVTATGMDTEIGKIAALMNATKERCV